MMETKHTPGPWHLDGHCLSTVLVRLRERGHPEAKHICGDYDVIARCEGDNWMPNARLIAAAPNLLDFAKEVAEHSSCPLLRERAQYLVAQAEGRS